MEEIAISKFKATCLAVLERVRKTGHPILVTRFGQPIARVSPPEVAKRVPRLGGGAGTMVVLGDIVVLSAMNPIGRSLRIRRPTKLRSPNEAPAGYAYLDLERC